VFLSWANFTKHNILWLHPFTFKTQEIIPYGWLKLYCIYRQNFHDPFFSHRAPWLFSKLSYCEFCCCEHWCTDHSPENPEILTEEGCHQAEEQPRTSMLFERSYCKETEDSYIWKIDPNIRTREEDVYWWKAVKKWAARGKKVRESNGNR
jgi:hypothetical protein